MLQILALLDHVLVAIRKGSALQLAVICAEMVAVLVNIECAGQDRAAADGADGLALCGGSRGGESGHDQADESVLDCDHCEWI